MNNLLKTLIKPDWDDNPKRSEILHAANLLQIGEFQLIQLAYKVWYNEELPEHKINKIFCFIKVQLKSCDLSTNADELLVIFLGIFQQLGKW